MSGEDRNRPLEMSAAVACGLLTLLAIVHFITEGRAWRPLDRFAADYGFDLRWPDHLRVAHLEPSADLGALLLADAAVMGETGRVKWSDLDEEAREAWLASAETREAELKSALDLALDAVASRPGWHLPYLFTGKLSYLVERRRGELSPLKSSPPWALALEKAARAAPGYDGTPVFTGAAWLESWGRLSPALRKRAEPVLKQALLDPDFVREALPALAGAFSVERAAALVPDQPESLRAARDLFAARGAVSEAKILNDRWLKAERIERRSDLVALEKKAKLGDTDGLRALCPKFAREHPAHEIDDAEGRRQAARLLALWPPEGAGGWLNDARGPVVRYLLDGRDENISGAGLIRSVEAMAGVPDPVRARAYLAGGDLAAAEEVARFSASASGGAFEWTGYFVARGWKLLNERRPEEARAVLGRISRSALNECDVLLFRREVEGWLPDPSSEQSEVEAALEEVRGLPLAVSERGSLFPCVDPDQDSDRFLVLEFESETPVLVTWGWNGGTSGSFVVDGKQRRQGVQFPLAGLRGRALFSLRPVAGKLPAVVDASFDPPIQGTSR